MMVFLIEAKSVHILPEGSWIGNRQYNTCQRLPRLRELGLILPMPWLMIIRLILVDFRVVDCRVLLCVLAVVVRSG